LSIAENVRNVQEKIRTACAACGRDPASVQLVAASKMNDASRVREAIAAGITICGENRVQEMREKREQGAYEGAQLHFIGTLQRNKVKYLVGTVQLIQSVENTAVLAAIDRKAAERKVQQKVLLEVNIGGEASKSGFRPEEIREVVRGAEQYGNIQICGLMAIPPAVSDPEQSRPFFRQMHQLFIDMDSEKLFNVSMQTLSMGMTNDYEIAIAEGATMVRVGTGIFGARNYNNVSNK
jgi:pyridoxal phosphate enzyme (YggS family)